MGISRASMSRLLPDSFGGQANRIDQILDVCSFHEACSEVGATAAVIPDLRRQ